jgi:hypothetical protein
MPRRFSTWFFAADMPAGSEASFEGGEVIGHRWVSPAAALDQLAEGEIAMWVPTSSVLQELVEAGATDAAALGARITLARTSAPRILDESPTIVRFRFGAVGGVPGREGLSTLHGRRELVLVDPGDPSDEALAAIAGAVSRRAGAIRAIVLTGPQPDRAAGAEAVAIPLGIPILHAPGAGRHLPYATGELTDGERLPADVELHVRLGPAGSGRLVVEGRSARQ